MSYYIINESKTKFSLDVEDQKVNVRYFAIFDEETDEYDIMDLSFDLSTFVSEMKNVLESGKGLLKNGEDSFSVTGNGDSYNIDMSYYGKSVRICELSMNIESILEYLK